MTDATLREWIEKAQFTVTSPTSAPHVNEPIQVVTVEGLLAELAGTYLSGGSGRTDRVDTFFARLLSFAQRAGADADGVINNPHLDGDAKFAARVFKILEAALTSHTSGPVFTGELAAELAEVAAFEKWWETEDFNEEYAAAKAAWLARALNRALTPRDGTPRPWVSEAALNKIAPFLEGVENAHLRATQIVSALASGDGSESAGLREALEQISLRLVGKAFPMTPHGEAEGCVTLSDIQDEFRAAVAALAPADCGPWCDPNDCCQSKPPQPSLEVNGKPIKHSFGVDDMKPPAPAISRPPTQGASLPPSRADLGGDRTEESK